MYFILKSIKIKTWFTKDEVLKFTNYLLGRLQNKNYSFKIFRATDIRSQKFNFYFAICKKRQQIKQTL